MEPWTVGFSTGCFSAVNILECLDRIRQRFEYLELSSAPAHLNCRDSHLIQRVAVRMRELELKAYSIHAPFGPDLDLSSPDRDRRRLSMQEFLRVSEAAARLGVRRMVLHPGPDMPLVLPQRERIERLRRAAESLGRVNHHCRELGLTLLLENPLPHLAFGSGEDLLWLLQDLAGEDVGMCLDTGHAHLAGRLLTGIPHWAPYLRQAHVHDNRGVYDDHLPPGRGQIDWSRVVGAWRQVHFTGPLILELAVQPDKTLDAVLAAAAHGREFLQSLIRRLD